MDHRGEKDIESIQKERKKKIKENKVLGERVNREKQDVCVTSGKT